MTDINNGTVTAEDMLARELELESEAAAKYAFRTDKCSYDLGHLNQNVFVCLTCNPLHTGDGGSDLRQPTGVCYACVIECHTNHEVEELFVKRAFRCDCGTPRMSPCALTTHDHDHHVVQREVNHDNRYNHNFSARYCVCDSRYDPATETGTMLQCIACQDWFHDRCISLDGTLPEKDTYDDLICRACVTSVRPFFFFALQKCKPFDAQLHLEPLAALSVLQVDGEASREQPICVALPPPPSPQQQLTGPTASLGSKRPRSPTDDTGNSMPDRKRARLDTAATAWLFLPEDWRDHVCRCTECTQRAATSLPWLHAPESVWTPEDDPDAGKSLYDAGIEMLHRVDRVAAIEGMHAMDTLAASLKDHLRAFAEAGKTVGEQDITDFFEALKQKKRT
ncbi:hypothetical protein BC828DRAFT_382124 [Blastocladiella britannica]|nr:hypothetical protein BC828DRAFT_382124 [Blastocladiella britannica]